MIYEITFQINKRVIYAGKLLFWKTLIKRSGDWQGLQRHTFAADDHFLQVVGGDWNEPANNLAKKRVRKKGKAKSPAASQTFKKPYALQEFLSL